MSVETSIIRTGYSQGKTSARLLPSSKVRSSRRARLLLMFITALTTSGLTIVGSRMLLTVPKALYASVNADSHYPLIEVDNKHETIDSDTIVCEVEGLQPVFRETIPRVSVLAAGDLSPETHQQARIQVDLGALTFARPVPNMTLEKEIASVDDILGYKVPARLQPMKPSSSSQNRVREFFGEDIDLNSKAHSRYDKHFRKYAALYFGADVDWRWFKAQAYVESGLKHKARSGKGAVGVMQIMPATFREIQKKNRFFRGKSLNNPEWNIAAGIYYNAYLKRIWRQKAQRAEHFNLMFASYNAGIGRVSSLTSPMSGVAEEIQLQHSRLPSETQRYLIKISVLMDRYTGTRLVLPNHA